MGEENIETRSDGWKNVKEVSEISNAQGKPAEVEVGESEVSGVKLSEKYKKVGENKMGEEIIETMALIYQTNVEMSANLNA